MSCTWSLILPVHLLRGAVSFDSPNREGGVFVAITRRGSGTPPIRADNRPSTRDHEDEERLVPNWRPGSKLGQSERGRQMKNQGSLRIGCLRLGLGLMLLLLCPGIGIAGSPTLALTHPGSGPPAVLPGDRDAWWDEPPDLSGWWMDSEIITVVGLESETANDFYSSEPTTIYEAVWWGEYFNSPGDPTVSAFNLRFYDDAGGVPGSIVAEYLETAPTDTFAIGQGPEGPVYEHHAAVSANIGEGTYWFSVQACDHAFPPQWGRLAAGLVTGHDSSIRSLLFGIPVRTPLEQFSGYPLDASQRFHATPSVPGACCFVDLHCEVIMPLDCAQLGGEYQGLGSMCDPDPCPLLGACCDPVTGNCRLVIEDLCMSPRIWMGPGTACLPSPCPPPSGGSIAAWGKNWSGQCNVPAPNADFVAIDGGNEHSLGLKSDGSIVAWGSNEAGQCDVPEPNAGFVAVAGGEQHSLGLKADASIVAWGNGANGAVQRPCAERKLRSCRGRRSPQPGPEVRRLHRGMGVQRHGPVQRARAERRLHGGCGGLDAQLGPEIRRDDRGLGGELPGPVQRPRAERRLRGPSREAGATVSV